MSRKLLAAVILIALMIGLTLVYFRPKLAPNPSSSSPESAQIRVEANASEAAVEKFGDYNYYFYYSHYNPDGLDLDGHIVVQQQGSEAWTYTLKTDITEKYKEIEFKITEIQPEYCILMVKYSP